AARSSRSGACRGSTRRTSATRPPGGKGSSHDDPLPNPFPRESERAPDEVSRMTDSNYDPAELAKFSALAHRWWDPTSEFRPLHEINPLRLAHIERLVGGLAGKRVLDVGCGGGILAEAM